MHVDDLQASWCGNDFGPERSKVKVAGLERGWGWVALGP